MLTSLGITLPGTPHLRPFVEVLAWATVDEAGLRLDADCVARAIETGASIEQIMHSLSDLTGNDLPEPARTKFESWGSAAQQISIRRIVVLEIANPDAMQAIRADWRLRPFLGDQLSAHHLVVRDEYKLRQRLIRRGYRVPPLHDPASDPIPRSNNDDPAYLWLALRICQKLAGLIPAPVLFPAADARSLELRLDSQLDALQAMVDAYVDRIEQALRRPGELSEELPQAESTTYPGRSDRRSGLRGRSRYSLLQSLRCGRDGARYRTADDLLAQRRYLR